MGHVTYACHISTQVWYLPRCNGIPGFPLRGQPLHGLTQYPPMHGCEAHVMTFTSNIQVKSPQAHDQGESDIKYFPSTIRCIWQSTLLTWDEMEYRPFGGLFWIICQTLLTRAFYIPDLLTSKVIQEHSPPFLKTQFQLGTTKWHLHWGTIISKWCMAERIEKDIYALRNWPQDIWRDG